jgi:hypothetical protein
MFRYALPFPTAPGKTEDDIKSIAAYFKANPSGYAESRKRLGITLERAYLQPSPMGNVVVSYVESDKPFAEVARGMATSDLEADRTFVSMVANIHGIDMRQPPAGPPPETIGEWVDPRVTARKAGLGFMAPLLPGKSDAGRAFLREAIVRRAAEFAESRRSWGQNAEIVTLNPTPMGDMICVYLEGNDPVQGNRDFAASSRPFDLWFKSQLKVLFPPQVDFDKPVPAITQIFDSVAIMAKV